jgi:diguanylate cyclase (GGDEF)-like protein
MERLERAIGSSRQTGASFAVMAFGLDRFKSINETLGHETGDEVLAAVARRLRNCVSDPASLARLGGNQFAVLVEGVTPSCTRSTRPNTG